MKILIISSSVEDGGVRGIGRLTAEMSHALYSANNDVILLTGAPIFISINNRRTSEIDTTVANRYIAHYLKDGYKSDAFSTKSFLRLKVVRAIINPHSLLIRNKLSEKRLPSEVGQLSKYISFYLQVPYFYKITKILPEKVSHYYISKIIKIINPDVVISTSPMSLPKSNGFKTVQYIHDIMPLETLETPPDSIKPFRKSFSSAICNSDLIMTNSEDTKKRIIELDNALKFKTETVYIPYDLSSLISVRSIEKNIPQLFGLKNESYILFNSAIEERKNVERLLRAYSTVHSDIKRIPLVLVGGMGYKSHLVNDMLNTLTEPVRKSVIFTGYISDEERVALMKRAKFFIMPSIDEGLGLPVIESLALGTPCLTTHFGALDEYAPASGLDYIENPYSTAELSAKIIEIDKNAIIYRNYLSKARYNVLRQFSQKLIQDRINKLIVNLVRS